MKLKSNLLILIIFCIFKFTFGQDILIDPGHGIGDLQRSHIAFDFPVTLNVTADIAVNDTTISVADTKHLKAGDSVLLTDSNIVEQNLTIEAVLNSTTIKVDEEITDIHLVTDNPKILDVITIKGLGQPKLDSNGNPNTNAQSYTQLSNTWDEPAETWKDWTEITPGNGAPSVCFELETAWKVAQFLGYPTTKSDMWELLGPDDRGKMGIGKDILVSLHTNAGGGTGTRAFYYPKMKFKVSYFADFPLSTKTLGGGWPSRELVNGTLGEDHGLITDPGKSIIFFEAIPIGTGNTFEGLDYSDLKLNRMTYSYHIGNNQDQNEWNVDINWCKGPSSNLQNPENPVTQAVGSIDLPTGYSGPGQLYLRGPHQGDDDKDLANDIFAELFKLKNGRAPIKNDSEDEYKTYPRRNLGV